MNVFVFKPTNEFIGKFPVGSADGIQEGFQKFLGTHVVEPYDYLECEGKTLTVMAGKDGLELAEGRLVQDAVAVEPLPGDVPAEAPDSYGQRVKFLFKTSLSLLLVGTFLPLLLGDLRMHLSWWMEVGSLVSDKLVWAGLALLLVWAHHWVKSTEG